MDTLQLLTAKQLAERFQVKRDTIYKWCKRGMLPYWKNGGTKGAIRISYNDALEFYNKRRRPASNE